MGTADPDETRGVGRSTPAGAGPAPLPEAGGDIRDLFVIGGGINGCGIARDAAGRGLSVTLAEMGDLAQATSSASTKLFHGGLRYLEYFEFRLVREALAERETLLVAMPHISWPMRFVLPLHPGMRFDAETPAARLLRKAMPWMKGRRPAWMIRLGLFLYDRLGRREILPGTRSLDLTRDPAGGPLKPEFRRAYEYSDCWVDDARLVVLNARAAADMGAEILTRRRVTAARREGGLWRIDTDGSGGPRRFRARALVNAAGPWIETVLGDVLHARTAAHIRLVRGSHIVVPRLYEHDRAYFFQGSDGRICFAIPYEQDFTLIGTTDQDHEGAPLDARCGPTETDYLCAFASRYFERPVRPEDVVWSYSGVRPLYDDGASSASAATREYVLTLDVAEGAAEAAPLLNVFGGKITTYRRLAEHALQKLAGHFPAAGSAWTARVPLPGGDFPHNGAAALAEALRRDYPFLGARDAARLTRAYGTEARALLGRARGAADLGRDFGAGLTEAELEWLAAREFAETAEDVLWRRSKLGLRLDARQAAAVGAWFAARNHGAQEKTGS